MSATAAVDRWAALVKEHTQGIFGLAMHMLGRRAEAEDVVQETFLRAYVALERRGAKVHTSLKAWLSRIAVNLCYDRLRRKSWHEIPAGQGSEPAFTGDTALRDWVMPWSADPVEAALRGDQAETLRRALNALPLNHRTAVILRYSHDLSYREIADVLDVPENTVATWLRRAHLGLRRQLEKEESVPCNATAHA